MQAALILETGKIFIGEGFGAGGEVWGEVVFNTGMTGYQEVLTDPSYVGQIVCMTYPLIGNYGINSLDNQSQKIQVQGFIVKEAARNPNHWQMEKNLSRALAQAGVVGIKGIDTRALTRLIREHGVLRGAITSDVLQDLSALANRLQDWEPPQDVVAKVSTEEVYTLDPIGDADIHSSAGTTGTTGIVGTDGTAQPLHVVVMDFGIKDNILRAMREKGFC